MTGELLRVGPVIGRETMEQVKSRVEGYLSLANTDPVDHLSEYVGKQMIGDVQRWILEKYFASVAGGKINAGHGYDEDPISVQVVKELKEITGAKEVAIVPTGTGANLDLIASFCDANEGEMKFVACDSEHTVNTEGKMLQKAGIKKENMILMPSKSHDGIVLAEDLAQTIEKIDGKFIFQMAIPTNEGVVPTLEELKLLIDTVHNKGGYFLIDGARLTNALVNWGAELGILTELGVDGFTLGTSKKGGLAEVVCINNQEASAQLLSEAKSYGHVSSKESPLSLVTGVFLTTGLWRKEAESENIAATAFAEMIKAEGIIPEFTVGANSVFITLSKEEQEMLASDPDLGWIYSDYGADSNISRIAFTGFQSQESVMAVAKAVCGARNKDVLKESQV